MKESIVCKKWDIPIKKDDFQTFKKNNCPSDIEPIIRQNTCQQCCPQKNKKNRRKRVLPMDIAKMYQKASKEWYKERPNLRDPIELFELIDGMKWNKRLPYPLNQPDEVIDIGYQDCLSPKCLKVLTASYSENIVKRICMTLLKFDLAISYFDLSVRLNNPKIKRISKIEERITSIKTLLLPDPGMRPRMPPSLKEQEKNWKNMLEQEKESLSIKPYAPLLVLKNHRIIAPPVSMPPNRPSNPFLKALQIIVYNILDTGINKGVTEELTATIINDFFKKKSINLNPKKLTTKNINHSLFTP